MVTRSVTPLSTAIGTGASPMDPTSAAPERSASMTAEPPLKSANSTEYGASLPALARFHGSDCVPFCSATTSLVPAGTSALLAIFTESIASPASSSESPQAGGHEAKSPAAQRVSTAYEQVWTCLSSFVGCTRHGSELDSSVTPSSASRRRRSVANSWESRARGLGTVTSTSSEIDAVGQDDHPVGQQDRLVDVVGDQQHGRLVPTAQGEQQPVHLDPGERVERAERLVEQEQFGLAHQRAGQRDTLRLSPGQRPWPHLGLLGQVHLARERLAPALAPRRSQAGRRSRWSAHAATAAAAGPGTRSRAAPAPGRNRRSLRPAHRARAGMCSCPSHCGPASRRTRPPGSRG